MKTTSLSAAHGARAKIARLGAPAVVTLVVGCGARTLGGPGDFGPGADGSSSGNDSGSSGGGSGGLGSSGSGGSSGSSSGGSSGTRGGSGSSGAAGSSGSSGSTGSSGSSGSNGSSGSMGSSGSSGSGGSSGSSSGVVCPGLAANEELIDNMNDGSRFIPNVHGRAGAWQVADDATPGAMIFPPLGTFPMSSTGDPCRLLAARTYGGQFALWGSLLYVGLGGPYDASAFRGVSFWAKVGASSPPGVRIAFPDKDTDPAGAICSTVIGAGNGCYDHYGKQLVLSTSWTKVTVRFTELTQGLWGNLARQFDPASLYRIEWDIPPGGNFDIWIDDLAFLTQ